MHRLPLTSATVVCSSHPGLMDLAGNVSCFLDPCTRHWTLERASENGHVQLLRRLMAHEPASTLPQVRALQFRRALAAAVRFAAAAPPSDRQSLEVLECLRAYYPTGTVTSALRQAVALGSTHVAQWLVINFPNIDWRDLGLAAVATHVEVLKWLKSAALCDEEDFADALEVSAGSGRLASAKWLLASGAVRLPCRPMRQHAVLLGAVDSGHRHVIDFLHDDAGFRFGDFGTFLMPIDRAASAGSLAVVQWLHEHGFTQFTKSALFSAVRDSSAEIVRWLLANGAGPLVDEELCLLAADCGNVEVLRMLYAVHPAELNLTSMVYAACNGKLEFLQWVFPKLRASYPANNDGYGYSMALFLAAGCGHLEVVQWLFRNVRAFAAACGSFEERAVSNAAGNGHEAIARWLHAQLDWQPQYELKPAATNGHMHLVKWLVETSGALLRHDEYDEVAANGHVEILEYICARLPYRFTGSAMDLAAEDNHLDTVKWLYERGVRGLNAMDSAAKHNHLRIVKWLHVHTDIGCSKTAMDAAASLEMVQWLHENRSEGCTTAAMDTAAERGDFDTLLFLHENRREGCTANAIACAYSNGHEEIYEWLCEAYPAIAKSTDVQSEVDTAAYWYRVDWSVRESKRQRMTM